MTDKNANAEIRKEFCPNCEKDTECIHAAELYECQECGEDFAKYIVSRNCNVSDVSMTQDVTTPELPEDALHARIAELEEENDRLQDGWFRDETICPDGSLRPKVSDLLNRIAELEAERRWIPVGERLPEEKQSVLALDRTGTAYHWEYSKCLSNIFVGYYTHWMPLPEPPEVV